MEYTFSLRVLKAGQYILNVLSSFQYHEATFNFINRSIQVAGQSV